MTWRKVSFPAGEGGRDAGNNLLAAFEEEFEIAFIAAGVPERAALFVDHSVEYSTLYFSPDASRIFHNELNAVRADDCAVPEGPGVGLLVGHPKAIDLLKLSC